MITVYLKAPNCKVIDLKNFIMKNKGFGVEHQQVFKGKNQLQDQANLMKYGYTCKADARRLPCVRPADPKKINKHYADYKIKVRIHVPREIISGAKITSKPISAEDTYHIINITNYLKRRNPVPSKSTTTFQELKDLISPNGKIILWVDGTKWTERKSSLKKTLKELGATSKSYINVEILPPRGNPTGGNKAPQVEQAPIDIYQTGGETTKVTAPTPTPDPTPTGPVNTIFISSNPDPVRPEENHEAEAEEEDADEEPKEPVVIKVRVKELETGITTGHKIDTAHPLTELLDDWLDVRLIDPEGAEYLLVYKGSELNLGHSLADYGVTEDEEIVVVKDKNEKEKED